jgi:hypothetical protein
MTGFIVFCWIFLFARIHAFSPIPILPNLPRVGQTTVFSSSIGKNNNPISLKRKSSFDRVKTKETEYMEELRQELIAKYVDAGRTQTVAETEVDSFLLDTQRSGDYIEMRLRTKEESDLGFEEIIWYAFAFTAGLISHVAANYYLDLTQVRSSSYVCPSFYGWKL